MFQEITSCPATMEAENIANACRMFPGHEIEMAVCKSAPSVCPYLGPDINMFIHIHIYVYTYTYIYMCMYI